jgi:hypothetical protein
MVLLLQEELRGIKRMQDAHNAALAAEDALMEADPFDPEAQRKIEELIQRKNIEENFAAVRNKGWWGGLQLAGNAGVCQPALMRRPVRSIEGSSSSSSNSCHT